MSKLSDVRASIAGELEEVVTTTRIYPEAPDMLNPPLCFITTDEPYLSPITDDDGKTFNETHGVNLILVFIFGQGSIAKLQQDADDFIGDILSLPTMRQIITEVSGLYEVEIGEQIFTAFQVRVRKLERLI